MIEKDKNEKPLIRLVSSKELEDEYRALLLSEWTLEHLLRSLRLIERQLGASGLAILFHWEQEAPPPRKPSKSKARVSPNAAEYVREFVEHFDADLPEVPVEMPARQDEEKVRLAQWTEKASVYLTLQVFAKLSGAIGLLNDCQSLVFSGCVHVLLPDLNARRMVGEKDLLLNSLWMHVKLAWDEEPAHKYFLQSQFFSAVDMPDKALESLHKSFILTLPTGHDWITKAQAYWAGLIDARQLDDAKEFVLQTLRAAPPEHIPELTELIDETYQYIYQTPRGRGRGGSKGRAS
jgi:hypothetical protein